MSSDHNVSNNELERSLGRIEGKLDAVVNAIQEHVQDDKESFKEIKTRVAVLEKKIYAALGAIALVSFFLTTFTNIIIKH